MVLDLETYRSAHALIRRHGKEAVEHAARRAEDLLKTSDFEGAAFWRSTLDAVNVLLLKQRPDGSRVH